MFLSSGHRRPSTVPEVGRLAFDSGTNTPSSGGRDAGNVLDQDGRAHPGGAALPAGATGARGWCAKPARTVIRPWLPDPDPRTTAHHGHVDPDSELPDGRSQLEWDLTAPRLSGGL